MKRLLAFSLLAILGIALNAQIILKDKEFHGGFAGNTTISGTTASSYDIYLNKPQALIYNLYLNLDSAGDGTDFLVLLQGSNDGTNFVTITSQRYGVVASTSNDTTIIFHNLTETNTIAATLATFDETRRGTAVNGAHYIIAESDSILISDSLLVQAQTITFTDTVGVGAQTTTTTETVTTSAITWKQLRILITGQGAGAGCTLDWLSVGVANRY